MRRVTRVCQETLRNGPAGFQRGVAISRLVKLSTKRRALLLNGALAVLLVAGAGVAYASLNGGKAEAPATSVPTARVTRATVTATVSASGSVESAKTRSLSFGVSGTVAEDLRQAGGQGPQGPGARPARRRRGAGEPRRGRGGARGGAGRGHRHRLRVRAVRQRPQHLPGGAARPRRNRAQGPVRGHCHRGQRHGRRLRERQLVRRLVRIGGFRGLVAGRRRRTGGGQGSASGSGGFIELADTGKLQIVGNFTEADVTRLKVGQPATFTFDALPGVTAGARSPSSTRSPAPATTWSSTR